jgi:uncharacterized protein (DUF2384 family)
MTGSTPQTILALREHLLSEQRVAELLDVSPEQIKRWLQGEGIDESDASRVELLGTVMSRLLDVYPLDVAEQWLQGLNPYLGNRRPIDLIRANHSYEVLAALAQQRAGGFA